MSNNIKAKLLVENGSHVNARDSSLRTPLIMISIYLTGLDNWYYRDKFARLFLDHQADPNLSDCFGLTPLIHAAINGQTDYVKVLLSYERTNYKQCDKAGNNALMLASRFGQVQALHLLAEHICSDEKQTPDFVDCKNFEDKSALDLALEGQHLECVSLLKTLKETMVNRQQSSGAQLMADNNIGGNLFDNRSISHSISDSFKINNSLGVQSSSDTTTNGRHFVAKSHTKSHDNICQTNSRSVTKNGIKLPPINGKRFVDYNDWNKQQNNENDRKTI